MRRDSSPSVDDVWRSLQLAQARVRARLDADLVAGADMALGEYEVLELLHEAPRHRLRMNELAERARLSPSGLTRRFDALVRRGWVARERCDDDRRGVLARLEPAGSERFEQARRIHEAGERRYFTDLLSPEELEAITGAMARVAASNEPGTDHRAPAATEAALTAPDSGW